MTAPVFTKITEDGIAILTLNRAPVNALVPTFLEDIAKTAAGRFYQATDREQLSKDFHDILDEFEKSRLVDYAAAEKSEIYHWFLIPGLLLLGLELLLSQVILRRFP